MKIPSAPMVVFWILAILAPFAICAVGISFIPSDQGPVPLHWNASGEIDRYGSPSEFWIIAPLAASGNALFAVFYLFSDALYDHGLVHGISIRAVRPFLVGAGVFMVLVTAAIMAWIVSTTISAM